MFADLFLFLYLFAWWLRVRIELGIRLMPVMGIHKAIYDVICEVIWIVTGRYPLERFAYLFDRHYGV